MTIKRINRAIKHLNLEIVRGKGYAYFIDPTGNQIGDSVWVCYLNQLTIDRWIEQAKSAIDQSTNLDRWIEQAKSAINQ